MGVRTRIHDGLTRVAKVFGPGVPEQFRQGEEASQMTPASPFSPGTPIGPYDGYDRHPRQQDYVTGFNIATRPRTHERVSFETLRGLVEAYDIAQICIWHRIDSIRSLDWKLVAAEGVNGDVSDAIAAGMAALAKPDRENDFDTWLAKYLYDVLAYDAGCLYRLRNRAGRAVGLLPVDGTLIAPLLDYWGRSPEPPAEAYVQYAQGLPFNWLTRDDIIYEPFRPRNNSPYGTAPLESIILNANTDMRFQVYFLQRFTDGNLPAAFAAAPESWSPDQIEQFQAYWDAMMYGDQSGKHQIKWMPPGSKFEWSNEKDFSDVFSLFMMRKSCAAYHTVPSDLGFTEDVNRSSGESQADVQHKVGELPLVRKIQRVVTGFLQNDLGLPLKHAFDLGEEQDDRLNQAQADDIYIKNGTVSASYIAEMRFGRSDKRPVPRYIFSERAGPIPLNSLEALAGEIDPETAAPAVGAALPHTAFTGIEGVVPNPPLIGEPLAEEEYGPKALPPAGPPQPGTVAKEAEGAAVGITSDTGIYGDPLIRDDDEPDEATQVAKEMAVFRRFERARRKSGEWRDFEFRAVAPVQAHNLNDDGRLGVRKAAGEVAVAGLAVMAADTGRVLMLQRALCDDDPAAGKLEFPGGHLEPGEGPLEAAWREWSEETGAVPPPGVQTGSWVSPNGVYQGIVWTTEREASVPVRGEAFVPNPDDPDGDQVEAILWMDPADLPGNSAVRAELLDNIDAVMTALGCNEGAAGDCCGADCCTGGCCDGTSGCGCGPLVDDPAPIVDEVAKAGDSTAPPKGRKRKHWPGWDLDLQAVEHWAPLLAAALAGALSKAQAEQIAAAYIAEHPVDEQGDQGKREAVEAAAAWLAGQLHLVPAVAPLVPGILADAHLIGGASAAAMTDGGDADLGGWQPGDTDTARQRVDDLGLGAGLSAALAASGQTAEQMAGGYVTKLGRALVDGMASGLGAAAIGASLVAALSDPGDPNGSVLTAIVTGMAAAALAWYLNRKVKQGFWQTENDERVCAACLANQAAGPLPMGRAYPSGDTAPPCHNRCRCALVPA